MSFSNLASSLCLITFSLLHQTVFGAEPIFHFCSTPENFTANGPYESNLNRLTSYLCYHSPPTGFGKGSIGWYPDQTYGLALCRGDASTSDCKTCVVEASGEIRKLCPYNKAAIIWYDNCLLKYSNNKFFGQIDNRNKFSLWNGHVVSEPVPFNEKTKKLLSQLAIKVQGTSKLFATGELEIGQSTKLYGLVQCTKDLSRAVCKTCLDDIIGELPSCCDGQEGGRVVSGSCNFRYEIYPFVNA